MKIIITESRLERIAFNWLNDNFGDLEPYETEEHTCCLFYLKNKNAIFEYNKKDYMVGVSYNEIWWFFESYFSMESQEISKILKKWIEEHYNLKVGKVYNFLSPVLKT